MIQITVPCEKYQFDSDFMICFHDTTHSVLLYVDDILMFV